MDEEPSQLMSFDDKFADITSVNINLAAVAQCDEGSVLHEELHHFMRAFACSVICNKSRYEFIVGSHLLQKTADVFKKALPADYGVCLTNTSDWDDQGPYGSVEHYAKIVIRHYSAEEMALAEARVEVNKRKAELEEFNQEISTLNKKIRGMK